MLKEHVKCIKNFHKAASEIEKEGLKQYAQKTLPAVRIHLLRSEEAARIAGVDESTIFSILKDLPNEGAVISETISGGHHSKAFYQCPCSWSQCSSWP